MTRFLDLSTQHGSKINLPAHYQQCESSAHRSYPGTHFALFAPLISSFLTVQLCVASWFYGIPSWLSFSFQESLKLSRLCYSNFDIQCPTLARNCSRHLLYVYLTLELIVQYSLARLLCSGKWRLNWLSLMGHLKHSKTVTVCYLQVRNSLCSFISTFQSSIRKGRTLRDSHQHRSSYSYSFLQ